MARKVARSIEAVWRIESGRIVGVVARLVRDDDIGDDLLRLIFAACQPVLPWEAQTALTLKLLGGLSTSEIARAYVVPEATMAQRIMREEVTFASSRAVQRAPRRGASSRLASVLEVIYLIFSEGYAATSGAEWTRPALCEEARRLARMLAGILPQEPETHGLQALLEIRASQLRACIDTEGRPASLTDQDRPPGTAC